MSVTIGKNIFLAFTFIIVVFFHLALGQTRSILFKTCGGATDVKEMLVTPCDSDPCHVKRGGPLLIQANFTSNLDATKIKHEVGAMLEGQDGGLRVTFPSLKRDACKSANLTCPVKKGDFQQYSVNLNIQSFFPTVKGNATIKLITDQGLMLCLIAPVVVV